MNIQIFGKSKCFDTKKAERWFKERRIRFQSIDLGKYGISPGELKSVLNAVGLEALVDPKHPDAALLAYLAYDADKVEKLLDNPRLLKTPIVRNGRQATVGYCPEVWQGLGISKRAGAQAAPARLLIGRGPPPRPAGASAPPPPSRGGESALHPPGRTPSPETGDSPPPER